MGPRKHLLGVDLHPQRKRQILERSPRQHIVKYREYTCTVCGRLSQTIFTLFILVTFLTFLTFFLINLIQNVVLVIFASFVTTFETDGNTTR